MSRSEVTALRRPALVAAYASARHIPASDVAGVRPGGLHIGYDVATKTYWALAVFFPSPRARGATLLGFQDGGSTGVFARHRHTRWRMISYASQPLSCTVIVPRSVRRSWGFTSSGCANTGKSKPAPVPPLPSPAAVSPSTIASVAQQQVGVSDNPASLNFDFNCNPFTTLVGREKSSSGCGTDSKFNVLNENERWCSDFAEWVWQQAGVTTDLGTITGGADTFYTWALDRGQNPQFDQGTPHVGDAIVFYPSNAANGTAFADHVGLIVGVNSDGTLNLVNGDFAGTTNIRVEADNNVNPTTWGPQVWAPGEKWLLVSPTATGLAGGPVVFDPLSGNLEVYGTGTDGTLQQRAFDPGTGWSNWTSLGGSITGVPSAVFDPISSHLEVYVRGANGPLFENSWSPSTHWSGWVDLGGSITGSPVAIYDPASGNLEVYATGSNGTLQQRAWNKSGWSNWVNLGGSITGDPAPVYNPASGHLEIYARGANGPLFEQSWSPSTHWSGWIDLGGSITGSPAPVYDPASGNLEVYATGSDGTAQQIAWHPSSGWAGWVNLGGSLTGNPSPVYNPASTHLEIYIRGAVNSVYQKSWSGNWSNWLDLGGGSLTGSPDAISDPGSGNLEVYTLTTGHTVLETYWNPSTGWNSTNIGGSLAGL